MSCYLFTHFIGEKTADGEQIYFSVSRDGLHWQDLGGGKPILRSEIGDRGVRDPFVVRHPETGIYYLMATDLSIFHRQDWISAQYRGSRALIVWESADLVHWSQPRRVEVGADIAGCVWAPESVWDAEKNTFMVFFASMVQLEGDPAPKQRMYAVYTEDFCTFTAPVVYAQAENHLIDMTIVQDGDWYYRFTKDETTKRIIMERLRNLHDQPEQMQCKTLAALHGVEGPECYRLADGRWCLIADQFAKGLGYLPMVTKDLASAEFEILGPDDYHFGGMKKRHGGVIAISGEEMQRLLEKYSE